MTRTTTAHLNSIIEDINQLQPHTDGKYSLDINAGGYRLCYDKDIGGAVDCTDRVSLGELYRICFGIRKVLERGAGDDRLRIHDRNTGKHLTHGRRPMHQV